MVFRDGPAAGVELHLQRDPVFLRVVQARANNGCPSGWDALDQLDDEPNDREEIHVYKKVEGGFDCRHESARGQFADYEHFPDIFGESVRQTEAWQATVENLYAGAGGGLVHHG